MDQKYSHNIQESNWFYIVGALYEAADYIGQKFPDSDVAQKFASDNKFVHSRSNMGSTPYARDIKCEKLIDHVLENCGNGFPHLKKFFEHELRGKNTGSTYCDPARAAAIYKRLSHWGCFKADMSAQNKLPVQQVVDQYLNEHKTPASNVINFNALAKPDVYISSYQFDYKDDEEAGLYFNKTVNAVLALADAHQHMDDIKIFFSDLDRKTGKAYIKIYSERDFSSLLGLVCRKGAHVNSSTSFNHPDPEPATNADQAVKAIEKAPAARPLKRRPKKNS